MKQKIIETEAKYPDVLLYLSKDEESEPIVVIHAFGKVKENEVEDENQYCKDMVAKEEISFSSFEMASNFIKDFSEKSAISFCKEYELYYQ